MFEHTNQLIKNLNSFLEVGNRLKPQFRSLSFFEQEELTVVRDALLYVIYLKSGSKLGSLEINEGSVLVTKSLRQEWLSNQVACSMQVYLPLPSQDDMTA